MQRLGEFVKVSARLGYVALSWALVGFVVMQVFYAGHAVLVSPGDWTAHRQLGHLFSRLIFGMLALSIIGRLPIRFQLLSLALYIMYALQYVFIHLPSGGLLFIRALHAVNALALLLVSMRVAHGSWRTMSERSAGRILMLVALTALVLGRSVIAVKPGDTSEGLEAQRRATSLAEATEMSVPEHYKTLTNPIAAGDEKALISGHGIAVRQCAACHGADFTGTRSGAGASDLTRSAASRSDQFLMWAISEGSARGMPAWKSRLSEQERWQLVAFIKTLDERTP